MSLHHLSNNGNLTGGTNRTRKHHKSAQSPTPEPTRNTASVHQTGDAPSPPPSTHTEKCYYFFSYTTLCHLGVEGPPYPLANQGCHVPAVPHYILLRENAKQLQDGDSSPPQAARPLPPRPPPHQPPPLFLPSLSALHLPWIPRIHQTPTNVNNSAYLHVYHELIKNIVK